MYRVVRVNYEHDSSSLIVVIDVNYTVIDSQTSFSHLVRQIDFKYRYVEYIIISIFIGIRYFHALLPKYFKVNHACQKYFFKMNIKY